MVKGYTKFKNSSVKITDPLFGAYSSMVAEKIVPYQWDVLNDHTRGAFPTNCIENFRIAAGEVSGQHQGVVSADTHLYKWLETVAYCIENTGDSELMRKADEVIDLLARAQQEDGYLNTYFTVAEPGKRWTNLVEGHELYNAGHFIEAAVAYYNATAKEKVLQIAIRFADLICRTFGPLGGQINGYPGHQEIELALIKLYHTTGTRKYLECARYFIDERGKEPNYFKEEIRNRGGAQFFPEFDPYDLRYSQAHMAPAEQTTADGHAVRAMYMFAAMADLALDCEDEKLKNTCSALWKNVTEKRMYITGSIGSSGWLERFTADYDLPNSSNYSEACASVGLMMFGQRMASLTGDASYYEAVESALSNTILAAIGMEGDRYFYVNPLEVVPEFCLPDTDMRHVSPTRQGWFTTACCPPNIARTLSSLGQYIYARDDKAVYIHQFISSILEEDGFSVSMESEIAQTGLVKIHSSGIKTLKVRIPQYAGAVHISANGSEIPLKEDRHYAVLENISGDITIDFCVKPRFIAANRYVRADVGKLALANGPFVYCLEETDNGDNLASIFVRPEAQLKMLTPMEGLPGKLPVIEYDGERLIRSIAEDGLYGKPNYKTEPIKLRAIPYGLWCNRKQGEMLVWQKLRF